MSETNLRGSLESEFQENPDCYVIFATNGLEMGRMIAANKGDYCKEHQGDLVIFNANIITKTYGKIWYGDLNITHDFDNLKNVADQLKEDLYILVEGEARFGYEKRPIEILIAKARTVINCNKYIKEKKSKSNGNGKSNGTKKTSVESKIKKEK
jgi:hypothetical protein